MKMSEKTFKRRVAQLVKQLEHHPHKDEIVAIALDQVMDMDQFAPLAS